MRTESSQRLGAAPGRYNCGVEAKVDFRELVVFWCSPSIGYPLIASTAMAKQTPRLPAAREHGECAMR